MGRRSVRTCSNARYHGFDREQERPFQHGARGLGRLSAVPDDWLRDTDTRRAERWECGNE
jgi:hypothetical protein